MSTRQPLTFKTASEDWEFEAIHRLNYKTFVEEIPQHKGSPTHRLVDKFHAENTYLICTRGNQLAGMLAVRGSRHSHSIKKSKTSIRTCPLAATFAKSACWPSRKNS